MKKKQLHLLGSIAKIILLTFIFSNNSISQIKGIKVPSIIVPGDDDPGGYPQDGVPFACNPTNNNPCNYIRNNTFSNSCPIPLSQLNEHRPFFNGCIDYWTSSHGTPQININSPRITANANHASMWASVVVKTNGSLLIEGEGIAIGIPALTTNATYSLSLFKRYFSAGTYGAPDIDDFYVVLLKCSTFNSLRRTNAEDYSIPNIPSTGAQVIYHEINVNNLGWQNINQSFIANDTYDVLWIFPKYTTVIPGTPNETSNMSWLEVALPEIRAIASCNNIPPQILPSSYFTVEAGCSPTISPIIPYVSNHYCYQWECGGDMNFESNYSNSNQWYINDILINPSPLGDGFYDIAGIGEVQITNNSKRIRHTLSTSSGSNLLFKVQLKNTTSGYQQLTTPTYVRYVPTPFLNQNMGEYKANYTLSISTYHFGPGAIYTWSIPNTIVTDVDNTTPEASVYFPPNVPTPIITGTLTISNSPYCNGVYNIFFTYNPNLRQAGSRISEQKMSIIYPNPANSQITITANKETLIQNIEIGGLFTQTTKQIKVNKAKTITIDVSIFAPGVYNCQITTDKGIENQKLIIKR